MKAYSQKTKGALEVLEFPIPVPTDHDLLVKVHAVATNPVDVKVLSGIFSSVELKIVGWDAAGVVEAIGPKVTSFKKGDEVYFSGSIVRQGANAEFTLVDERIVGRKPKSLNWEQAASVPLCSLTAWEGLVEGASVPVPLNGAPNPNADKSLLVFGGAGGVGSSVIQVAKKILKFGKVIATASRPETREWCKKLGADIVIGHNNLPEELAKHGIQGGVHYTYVTVDLNTVFNVAVEVTQPTGKIIGITGFSGLDTTKIFHKRQVLVSEFMFARPQFHIEPEKQGIILNSFSDWIDHGVLVHTQNHHFEWSHLKEAHELQESGKAIGKITLTVKF